MTCTREGVGGDVGRVAGVASLDVPPGARRVTALLSIDIPVKKERASATRTAGVTSQSSTTLVLGQEVTVTSTRTTVTRSTNGGPPVLGDPEAMLGPEADAAWK